MDTQSKFDQVERVYNQRLRGAFFISTRDEQRTHFHSGCWITQCSHEPPRMLAEDQEAMIDRFFAGAQDIASLGSDLFIYKETGCPILKEAQAYFDCQAVNIVDNNDFLLVIGDVLSSEILRPEARSLTVNHLMEREKGVADDAIVPLTGFDHS